MNAQKIVLATDLSMSSRTALEWASNLARDTHAQLLVVHVEPGQPTLGLGPFYSGLPDPGIPEVARRLAATVPDDPSVACEHFILVGDPATEIVRFADSEHADLIVLGGHVGRTSRRLFSACVGETVMHQATCPVLICKKLSDDDVTKFGLSLSASHLLPCAKETQS